jgi:hypothetical protein
MLRPYRGKLFSRKTRQKKNATNIKIRNQGAKIERFLPIPQPSFPIDR